MRPAPLSIEAVTPLILPRGSGGGGERSEPEGAKLNCMRAPIRTFKYARSLRQRMTLPEVLPSQALRGSRAAGLRFRRQLDIAERARHDQRRNAWLAARNIRVLRVTAAAVLKADGLEEVLLAIEQAAAPSTAFGGPPPPLRG